MLGSEDSSWIDDQVRSAACEMLQVLFGSSRIAVVTFDAKGNIVGVNPQTGALEGTPSMERYRGVSLLDHHVLRRLGFADVLKQVLKGETIELTETKWVTLFSGEERFVDIIAGPAMVEGKVLGGIAYLVDATVKHRAMQAQDAWRRRVRELETNLGTDLRMLATAIDRWAHEPAASRKLTDEAREAALDLSSSLDDLLYFLQLESGKPQVSNTDVLETMKALAIAPSGSAQDLAVAYADPRLLRRILRNIDGFARSTGRAEWAIERRDGRLRILCRMRVASAPQLAELLSPTAASLEEGSGAANSLATARWLAEAMAGTLTPTTDPLGVCLDLPAADPLRAVG